MDDLHEGLEVKTVLAGGKPEGLGDFLLELCRDLDAVHLLKHDAHTVLSLLLLCERFEETMQALELQHNYTLGWLPLGR